MKLIKSLEIRKVGNRGYRFGLFECPICLSEIEKIHKDGVSAKTCSMICYNDLRKGVLRGPYKSKIISKKYVYIYGPEHPNAIGTRKLYMAEHRLVVEEHIGRFLTKDEVVHHIDEDTLNNSIENLKIMTASEHTSHHQKGKKRKKNGQFKI